VFLTLPVKTFVQSEIYLLLFNQKIIWDVEAVVHLKRLAAAKVTAVVQAVVVTG
jgi:hypothetical protein